MTTLYDQELDHLRDLVRDPDDVCHVFREGSERAHCGIPRSEVTHIHYGGVPRDYLFDYRCPQCGGPLCRPCWDVILRRGGYL